MLSWEKLRRKPANRWFDWFFAPILKFDERFARQYRFEPPSEFPLTSPYSSIVHHLSGPNKYALALALLRRSGMAGAASLRFGTLFLLSLRLWVYHPQTRMCVRLLGPCFKTGQWKPFWQNRPQAFRSFAFLLIGFESLILPFATVSTSIQTPSTICLRITKSASVVTSSQLPLLPF